MLSSGNYLLRQALLGLIGLSSGGIVAAGVFAFLAMIGVFPRLIGKTNTRSRIMLYETVIIIGGTIGNILDLFEPPLLFGSIAVLAVFGLCSGIFVACLVMSLAETLKALPVITRRIYLATGMQYVILSFAIGKLVGSLVFFYHRIGLS